jgi:hypothetical protein
LFEKGALGGAYIAFFRGEKAVLGKFRAEELLSDQANQDPFRRIRTGASHSRWSHEGGIVNQ